MNQMRRRRLLCRKTIID